MRSCCAILSIMMIEAAWRCVFRVVPNRAIAAYCPILEKPMKLSVGLRALSSRNGANPTSHARPTIG